MSPSTELELWAGLECTINRVGDRFFDQLERQGHYRREGDVAALADLGIKALRYPILWERFAGTDTAAEWARVDRALAVARERGVRPIVGLVHHGSGPFGTTLVDSRFAHGLAAFARTVAHRHPWIRDYTPVNEPLTTARFSGLYGLWYPHGRDERTFCRALLVQCDAVRRAMAAIREVRADARLVQTEDFGTVFATPALQYQADFENARRRLSLDLLCGRVDPRHPLWRDLLAWGASERELASFLDEPCPPAVVGVNYYLTSDRFLDERLERYPAVFHGGNGRHAYADVEAARVRASGIVGHETLLLDLWTRYGRPLAVTEAHAGATREEQLRWLAEAWDGARRAAARGADVRAVTVWSAFGSSDWDKQVVCCTNHYEVGAFDVRAPRPRPTAVAAGMRRLARGVDLDHPVIGSPGWWRRPQRLLFGPPADAPLPRPIARGRSRAAPLLVTGATGTLGSAFVRLCAVRGLDTMAAARRCLDVADPEHVAQMLDRLRPWAIVNAAGYVRVDDAEADEARCFRENAQAAAVLAEAAAARGIPLVAFSSDLVFDGRKDRPYVESDAVAPLGSYGRSKAAAEQALLARHPGALVVRTSAFFGPWDRANFVTQALESLRVGRRFVAAADTVVSPTYVPDLVHATLDLLIDAEAGVWHLSNRTGLTWAELARQAARAAGLDAELVDPRPAQDLDQGCRRPRYSVLGSERGEMLRDLDEALASYVRERHTGS